MNKPMPPTPLRQEDYLAIEAAVMETARGRWFLSEYARRNRNADTDTLLNAIDKLEKSVVRERAPASMMNRVKMDLADMASAIEKTKQEIAQIKHEDNDGSERFERASIELDAIVSQTESATGDILNAAEKIQEFAWTLREQGADEETCNALDGEATNIYMACSFQDLTGQRIQKIVDAIRYVESRINSMITVWGFESGGVDIDHTHSKPDDVRPDAHLLNGPALDGEGVEQDDVDSILNQSHDLEESNQDDVDALFDHVGSSDEPDEKTEFEAVSADVEFDVADIEFDTIETEALQEEKPSKAAMVDMDDLDWADNADDIDVSVSAETPTSDAEVAASSEADVFASADVFDAVSVDKDQADVTSEQADVFTSIDTQSEEADIFGSPSANPVQADVMESEADELVAEMETKLADLRDRVADFS